MDDAPVLRNYIVSPAYFSKNEVFSTKLLTDAFWCEKKVSEKQFKH